jgi:hypothetical protein
MIDRRVDEAREALGRAAASATLDDEAITVLDDLVGVSTARHA